MTPGLPERDKHLLQHFLAAIAYRTQKALRDAPEHYPDYSPGHEVRTPVEILRHMTSLMGYVRTFFVGGTYPMHPEPLPTFADETARFHEMLEDVGRFIAADTPPHDITTEQLLQGPFADVMTHVGQLAILRRMAKAPVASENFIFADIKRERLGKEQPPPARPDLAWKPFREG
ncbi:MAG: hypothetical protein H7Z40_16520 [Phycisphaerae bacterium]|nr:hypothetical protein [Gemmatimonadaceae bacterium]